MNAAWFTGHGSQATSPVLSSFTELGVRYVVVRVGRGTYDAGEPFAVLKRADCIITRD